uniref:Uncharacterized protein n=1 Tax=viral metagenome TaxID=1070528 RepID=A0A6C0IMC1_9ZZZZ
MGRNRSMRGGKLTGDSSYSSLIASSSDNSEFLSGQGGDYQQNLDRNNSPTSGEGNNIDMTQFKGLIPPGAYYGGKRRRGRKMRGGMGSLSDDSEAEKSDKAVALMETTGDDLDDAQKGGRRRRRMRGGESMTNDDHMNMAGGRRRRRKMRGGNDPLIPTEAMNPDTAPLSGGRRRRMRGGEYDRPAEAGDSDAMSTTGGRRRMSRRGGGVIATAALPFGLFGLQKYFQGRRSGSMSQRTRRHRR